MPLAVGRGLCGEPKDSEREAQHTHCSTAVRKVKDCLGALGTAGDVFFEIGVRVAVRAWGAYES